MKCANCFSMVLVVSLLAGCAVAVESAGKPEKKEYDVKKLVGSDKEGDELAAMIRVLVAPETWQSGVTSVEYKDGKLLVEQSELQHASVAKFLGSFKDREDLTAWRKKLVGASKDPAKRKEREQLLREKGLGAEPRHR